jgi:flagella basal body P-ring formation protein FlgA
MKKFSGLIAASILASGYAPSVGEELVAARNIRAGDVVAAADIATPRGDEALRRAAKLVGLEAVRNIYRGQPFSESDLKTPTLVSRNDIVTMEFAKGPMVISTEGRALDQGGLGDRVRVMNLLSKRIVTAVVVNNNTVRTRQ